MLNTYIVAYVHEDDHPDDPRREMLVMATSPQGAENLVLELRQVLGVDYSMTRDVTWLR